MKDTYEVVIRFKNRPAIDEFVAAIGELTHLEPIPVDQRVRAIIERLRFATPGFLEAIDVKDA